MLVDAGWSASDPEGGPDVTRSIPAIDIPALVAYGKQKNVGIMLWLHWTAAREQMVAAFPLYESRGIKGVKIDFMDRKDQEMAPSTIARCARRRSIAWSSISTGPTRARARNAPGRTCSRARA